MIKSISVVTLAALFATFAASTIPSTIHQVERWEQNPLVVGKKPTLEKLHNLRIKVRDTGCKVNICFALQGDDFITDKEFVAQKDFIRLLSALITTGKPSSYCAVQYGLTTKPISPITKPFWTPFQDFLKSVKDAKRVGGLDTNIAAALGYTGAQLISGDGEDKKNNKMIILGDGLESVGFLPSVVAEQSRKKGIEIFAVAVGGFNTTALKEIVGGNSKNVYTVNTFFDLSEIVYDFVIDVCSFSR